MEPLTVVQSLLVLVLPLALTFAAVCDVYTMTIPNWISLVLAIAFLPAALLGGWEAEAVALNYAAGVLVFAVAAGLFWAGAIGGADAKLAAATGVWVGFPQLMAFVLAIAVFGGVVALLVLGLRRLPKAPALRPFPWARPAETGETGVPYGLAIGLAGILLSPSFPVVAEVLARYA